MKKSLTILLTALLSMVGMSAFAASNTYYFKAIAHSTNEMAGKVYVAENTTDAKEYLANDTISFSKTVQTNNASQTLHFYAQHIGANKFVGWAAGPDTLVEGVEIISRNAHYEVSLTSNKTTEAEPALKELYAFFAESEVLYNSTVVASATGAAGLVSVATAADSEDFAATLADTLLNQGEAAHTYYLQAKPEVEGVTRFLGWYSDAACENQISNKATYTYNVTAESTDATAPSVFNVYAKFEVIPYYCSTVNAAVVGEGGVAVLLNSNAAVNYQTEVSLNQRVADKADHTYYLRADADYALFNGWYSDAACTELISANRTYTYNMTSESLDEAAPTVFNVYAKFIADTLRVSPFQFRNAGFEAWNSNNNEPAPGWHGPATAIGSMSGMAAGSAPAPRRVAGRTGEYAVELHSSSVIGVKANGNLSTGIMNMGSMTASASSNNNHTVLDDPNHRLIIAGQPDSLVYYSKYKKGETGDYIASAKVYIHDAVADFQDPVLANQQSHLMGYCYTPAPESEDWIRNAGAFEYGYEGWDFETVQATTKYVLCDLTTNPNPGGSAKDTLCIDDIAFVYNSELAAATYGEDTIIFVDGVCSSFSTVEYDEEALTVAANGRGASVEKVYDATSGMLTITVKGQDILYNEGNLHTYQMLFSTGAPTALDQAIIEHTAVEGIYDIMGRRYDSMQPGLNIVRMRDGSSIKIMR